MLVRLKEAGLIVTSSVRVFFGGGGLYSSMRDYLKLLRHLMQIHGKLQSMSFFYND